VAENDIRDANIPNSVDQEAIKKKLSENHLVSKFSKEGTKLLEETERPNLITLNQFEPFIPMFNMDKKKYEEDETYRLSMNRLYNQYVRGLGINLYQPTIVIMSQEDPTEVYFLDRVYTRFKSDIVDGKSMRDTVPSAIARNASTTRDQVLLEASVRDLVEANNTPEQRAYFRRIRTDSAIIQKNFVERNMSPEKRAELMAQINESKGEAVQTGSVDFELDDDD
jgi:hypothetical protein